MNLPAEAFVYTETTVHVPPEQYATDAPYQIAIIEWQTGAMTAERLTVRILAATPSERVSIGDRVIFLETRNGVPYFRRYSASLSE